MKCIICDKEKQSGIIHMDKFICGNCRGFTTYDYDFEKLKNEILNAIEALSKKQEVK